MSLRANISCWVQPAVTEQRSRMWFRVGKFWWRKRMRKDLHVRNTYLHYVYTFMGFLGGAVVKNSPASAGDARDLGSIPGLGRSPGGGNGNPLQYSCLGNRMDRGAWWATVHVVTESRTWLSTHTHTNTYICIIHMYVCMHTYYFC